MERSTGIVKRVIRRMLLSQGLYLGRFPQAQALEPHLVWVFSKLKTNCVLDVGANRGDYGQLLRDLGFSGRIVSFEPVTSAFDELRRRAQDDKAWRVFQYALGDHEQTAEINVLEGSAFSSFLTPNAFGQEQFGDRMHVARTETVSVKRLDDVLQECLDGIDEPRVFLKIDTQGYDRQVLEGFESGLGQIQALQLEVSVHPIYDEVTNDLADVLQYLRQRGFQLTGLFPITWDQEDQLGLIELDCVMYRRAQH